VTLRDEANSEAQKDLTIEYANYLEGFKKHSVFHVNYGKTEI